MVGSRGAPGAVFRIPGAERGEEVWEGALAGELSELFGLFRLENLYCSKDFF
jgi:hypothetical protein